MSLHCSLVEKMAHFTAKAFSALYGVLGLINLFAPHFGFSLFAAYPTSVDKMGWYYIEPIVRCLGLTSLGLAMALYCIGHTAKTTTDQNLSKCACNTVAAILATSGIGTAVLIYMYPELRTSATYAVIVLHHIGVGSEMLCMMGRGAKSTLKAAKEKTEAAAAKTQ